MCEGNKLLGDYCDNNSECLSGRCDVEERRCTSEEKASTAAEKPGYTDEPESKITEESLDPNRSI